MTTVYIIYSETHRCHYVGFTKNLRKRLKQHQSGQTKSLPAGEDWNVIWSMPVVDSAAARSMEKAIKARGAQRFLLTRST